MFKNNREKALLYVTVFILVFMAITALVGGWPKASASCNESQILKQSAYTYFERMPDDSYKIPEAELKQLVDSNNQDIYIVDIRAAKDFKLGHIKGAHNIPFKEVGQNLDKLPKDKTIIVHCYTGQTAGQTAAVLNMAGFKVRSLNGGMNNGWAKAGYPTVTD